jgi:hypothetical protein
MGKEGPNSSDKLQSQYKPKLRGNQGFSLTASPKLASMNRNELTPVYPILLLALDFPILAKTSINVASVKSVPQNGAIS